ncbi:MAG: T9SS type A sorting domain-containing protein [Flavobacteriales bacterium]|nr:T9SS type A sorting domain-containing protein [Flavobacteriales bacterium]MBP7407788.1 T9SS type A sorting domain-containing protein [Flavobacteriales bacterium]
MSRTVYVPILLLLLGVCVDASAQIQQPGNPLNWELKTIDRSAIPAITTPKLNMELIRAQDAITDQYKETPYRFGIEQEVDIDFFGSALRTDLPKGDRVWRLAVHCPNATSINFMFDQWSIPVGGEVTIWSADRSEFIGVFDHRNNKEYNSFAVGLVHSNSVVIEYYEQAQVKASALIHIGTIIHGYRPVVNKFEDLAKGAFGTSGSCNMNVNCPDGAAWQAEKRGVALILNGGSAWCTGSLINNTAQNGASYFLTAAHCNATESNWVFYFNHETAGCTGSTGPTNQSISGATQIATGTASDFHLVQLSSAVPASYLPYYNGWDRSNNPVSTAVGIHHPSGDVKKISFDDDPLQKTNYSSNTVTASGNHWRIESWERNTTTEGGSSGSPLFDQNHRIIGQLHGGAAACGNTASDWYGAFGNSWSGLSSFLDPLSTGAMTLNGFDPNSGPLPTCTDGIQNQGETGIDCGGPCAPCPCTGTNVTVSITFDNYPEETSWTIRQGTTTVASGGTYGSQPDGSTLNTVVCLPNGCYDFTINDSYGDGICCAYGNGSYTVSSSAGTHASGSTFTTSQTTNFCLGGPAATCTDGIQNQGETGIDCGGPCAACATCSDGIQNQGETGIDCGGPCTPCSTGCTYGTINTTSFDTWGIWSDGGTDCQRSTADAANAYSPSYCVRLRDNTSTSTTSTSNLALATYSELTVTFFFKTLGFATGEDFWLQLSTNGGSTYSTKASYAAGTSFANGSFYSATVVIPGPFTNTTRLRFRCDASTDSDQLFVDNVTITGCNTASLLPLLGADIEMLKNADPVQLSDDLLIFPNPADGSVNIAFTLDRSTDVSIMILDMQGRIVEQRQLGSISGYRQLEMGTAQLESGTYILTVIANEQRRTERFVVYR